VSRLIHIILIVFLYAACRSGSEQEVNLPVNESVITEALIDINSYMVKRNHQHIVNFVKRSGWDMNESPDGIWFEFLQENSGSRLRTGDNINIEYTLKLINGDEPLGHNRVIRRNVTLGSSGIVSGLSAGLNYMCPGDSARIIVPPYLAYGNFGDSDKIPPDAILIYNVKILKAK
jgi:FKBP-type peptidyl-prolyl cis-trans isomerase